MFSTLCESATRHTEGEEPEVQDVLKKYTVLKDAWKSISEEVKGLLSASKPWNELTDRFEELHCCIGELEGLVEWEEQVTRDLNEAEGKDLLDAIVNFKVWTKARNAVVFEHLGSLWFVCAVHFNGHLWHAQTINFHLRSTECLNATESVHLP